MPGPPWLPPALCIHMTCSSAPLFFYPALYYNSRFQKAAGAVRIYRSQRHRIMYETPCSV